MKVWKILKKILAYVLGLPLLIIGVILIPLPGPGILIMLLGLIILSTEITWLQPHRDRSLNQVKAWWAEYRRKQAEINRKYK